MGRQFTLRHLISRLGIDKEEVGESVDIVDGQLIEQPQPVPVDEPPIVAPKEPVEVLASEAVAEQIVQEKVVKRAGRPRNREGFFLYLKAAGKSENTCMGYKYDLRFWDRHASTLGKSVYNLSIVDLEAALAGKDINTSKRRVAALRSLAKWYLRDGLPHLYVELQKLVLSGRN